MSAISSFKSKENKYDVYGGKGCMKKFCESLRERKIGISNIKSIKLLTNEQQKRYGNAVFVKKIMKINMLKIKNIVKFAIMQANIEVLHIAYVL